MNARALAVLGTGSDVGKSVIAAGFGRLLLRRGVRVAPFKAQNMSLNSFVTPEGGEIGRAQALQADACGVPPHVDMNPLLLKPESETRCQVVVHGRSTGAREAGDYLRGTGDLFPAVEESWRRLAAAHDVVLIEGAGSAAELNLRPFDLVNWRTVEMADARVVLVADIDRGGVFAQVLGTLDLLAPSERARVIGIVVNRFRGDASLFDDGRRMLEERGGVPVLGVVPWLRGLTLEAEDSLDPEPGRGGTFRADAVNLAGVLLTRMSNFTDLRAPGAEPDVAFRWAHAPRDLEGADAIVIPGSKNTLDDLRHLRDSGMADAILRAARAGTEIVGLCGGYQIMGREVADPDGVEGGGREPGLGLLDATTVLLPVKTTVRTGGFSLLGGPLDGLEVHGYEIHAGHTARGDASPCFRIPGRPDDGTRSADARAWGTYLHGVFDGPRFRRAWLNRLRARKGLEPLPDAVSTETTARLGAALDRWADHLRLHLDLGPVFAAVGLEK